MSLPDTAAIIGLGLMGGSLATDLAAAGVRVLGFDSRAGVADAALAAGSLSGVLDETLSAAQDADLVVIATPVDSAVEILARLKVIVAARAVITDVGSTKARIVAAAESAGLGAQFVGSHPLAGDHRSGWTAARAGLYEGAEIYISPTRSSSEVALSTVEALWSSVGGRCSRIEAVEHDRLMAWISHLPQVVSSALAISLREAGCMPGHLGPGGRDMTRLAASSSEMWTAIALTNDAALIPAISAVRGRLEDFESALRSGDSAAVRMFFQSGNDWTS